MKPILTLVLALSCSLSHAAPTLTADPAPLTAVQPDSASVTVNGGSPVACTVTPATATVGAKAQCDLASITAAGTYTLVLTWCNKGGIVNTPGGATNTTAGCASSAPFSYKLQTAVVPGPTLSVSP